MINKKNNLFNLFNLFSAFRLENSLKNILIFLPLIFSQRNLNSDQLTPLLMGFFFLIFMTSICYVTNDFSDRHIDKNNKLKIKKINISKKNVILLNVFLFSVILILFFKTILINQFIFFYLILFFSYNFFFKHIRFLDILFLVSFYLIRLLYGAELVDIDLSKMFLIFFTSTFLILAIFKRMMQISNNNLIGKNDIIQYSYSNFPFFKNIIVLSTFINLSVLIIFLIEMIYPNTFINLSAEETNYDYNIYALTLGLLIYFFWLIRIIYMVFNKKIKKDFYSFVIKDKISYVVISAILLALLV
tara:strand:- start:7745 stop:8650 length:906 start_codon:yes stop_codon:yes gene_type:complete